MTANRKKLTEVVQEENMRESLEAIRDYIAHQLEANLCNTCLNSRLRTGDQASLILRLQTVLEQIEKIPVYDAEVSDLEKIRNRAGTPRAVTRQQGGRHPSGTRKSTPPNPASSA
jgi:hypothetical protein